MKQITINEAHTSFEDLSFAVLCIYLATNTLSFIPWIPAIVNTLSLYGFVGIAIISMCFSRVAYIGGHIKWYGSFTIACLISLLYAPSVTASFSTVVQMIKIFVFLFAFVNIVNSEKRIRILMEVLSISTVILFIYLFRTNQLILENARLGNDLVGNANAFSSMFMIGAFGSIYGIFYSDAIPKKLLFFSCFLCEEFAMALAGGRKFFILPIIMLLVLFVVKKKEGKYSFVLSRIAIVALALVVTYQLLLNVPLFYNSIGYRFEGLISGFTGTGAYDRSARTRVDMINTALQLWGDSPLLGNGVDSFKQLASYDASYSHNNFVELLSGVGIIGFIIYYSVFVRVFVGFSRYRLKTDKKYYWLVLTIILLLFDYGAVTYYAITSQIMIALIPIGLYQLYAEEELGEFEE